MAELKYSVLLVLEIHIVKKEKLRRKDLSGEKDQDVASIHYASCVLLWSVLSLSD